MISEKEGIPTTTFDISWNTITKYKILDNTAIYLVPWNWRAGNYDKLRSCIFFVEPDINSTNSTKYAEFSNFYTFCLRYSIGSTVWLVWHSFIERTNSTIHIIIATNSKVMTTKLFVVFSMHSFE